MRMQSNYPTRKVQAGAAAGAISALILFTLNTYITPDRPLTAEVGAAITTLLAFLASYTMPPGPDDQPLDPPVADEDDGYVRRRPDEMA